MFTFIDRLGRHKLVRKRTEPTARSTEIDKNALEAIFNHQKSEVLNIIEKINKTNNPCCLNELMKIKVDVVDICVRTLFSYEDWFQERQSRITGTTCYCLFTYMKNKAPDGQKKILYDL